MAGVVAEVAFKAIAYGFGLLLLILIGMQIYLSVVFPFTEQGKKKRAERSKILEQIEASRRVEVIDGKRWEVITKPHTLIRNKKSGRYAAVLRRGGQNIPWIEKGELLQIPRWVQVQPLTKELIPAKSKQYWTQMQNWEIAGMVDVHWKDRLANQDADEAVKNA